MNWIRSVFQNITNLYLDFEVSYFLLRKMNFIAILLLIVM